MHGVRVFVRLDCLGIRLMRLCHCLTPFVYGSDGIIYGSDATVGVTHTSDEEWEEGEQGDVFHGEEDESLSGGGEVDGDGCGQEEDNGGVCNYKVHLSRPTAEKWRVNCIKHYDLMVELWAADRATRSGVRTARQARRQRVGPRVSVDLNQNIEYIPEQPQWAGFRDPTPPSPPPSVDEYSPGQTQSVPSVPSGGTSSS
ncbi:uncharacterized protein HKW66_Vig0126450 [Vigna angularis]|uniref:Uncharacterized protein n=1 Tax=Phaseolus angularis TaxID=3914 RepID=A0A8T0K394_PHAAN|nr:uncharacterized protein HKW66_Vig0126450 [Vigna angularis]